MTQPANIVLTDQKNPMSKVNSSPERHTFQKEGAIRRAEEAGEESNQAYIDMWDQIKIDEANRIHDPEWQKNNMEYELRSTNWMLEKVKESRVYSQNLYAAMCNNDFQKLAVVPILKEELWSCSWRSAGGIIADMREEGDYIDWYCSGIRNGPEVFDQTEYDSLTDDQKLYYKESLAYVSESTVTEEINADLKKLGWVVIEGKD